MQLDALLDDRNRSALHILTTSFLHRMRGSYNRSSLGRMCDRKHGGRQDCP